MISRLVKLIIAYMVIVEDNFFPTGSSFRALKNTIIQN
jgi:hypothetical protein